MANGFFNPVVTERSQAGPLMSQGLQQLGAGIGAAVHGHRRKKEQKRQEDMAVEWIMIQGLASDEQEARAGVKGVGLQGIMQFAGMQQQQEQFAKQFTETQRSNKANETIRGKSADASLMNAETNQRAQQFNEEMSVAEIETRLHQIEINRLNAQTAAQRAELAEEELLLQREKFQRSGELMELPRGGQAFFDGSKWVRIPGLEDKTSIEKAKEMNAVLDEGTPLGEYYLRTRDEDGTIKSGIFGTETLNPAFENTLKQIGLPSFEKGEDGKPVEQSTVIDLDAL